MRKKFFFLMILMIIFIAVFNFKKTSIMVSKSKPIEVNGEIAKLEENQIRLFYLPIPAGESTLIQLANQDFYLIDTGYRENEEELRLLLKQHGVTQLKGIILTNSSKGQIGGIPSILQEFMVERIYLPHLIAHTFKLKIPNHETTTYYLNANDELKLGSNVKLKVLGPTEPLSLSPQANSLVFQLVHKDIRFLFTGEINGEIEKRLVERYNLDSEILKVSDFASSVASISEFLREVDPQVGVIFASDSESYGLSDDVLERLNESWIDVYITKSYGEVQISSNGENYDVEVIKNSE